MKKYKISAIGIAIVMLLGILSCERDLSSGNFEIPTINDITIEYFICGNGHEGVEFEVALGSHFTLKPRLTFELGEASSTYIYAWYEINPNPVETGASRLISQERTLSLLIDAEFSDTSRPYRMMFRITDQHTSVTYSRIFTMQVRNPLQIGWYALTERANGFEIDVVALFMGELRQQNNVLDFLGSELPRTDGQIPKNLLMFPNMSAPTITNRDMTNYTIMIQTDVATNMVRSADFSFDPSFDISAFVLLNHPYIRPGFNPNRLIPMLSTATAGSATRLYMHYNDNFYIFNRQGPVIPFWEPINRMRGVANSRFNVAPFIAGNLGQGVVLFDMDNNRFVRHLIPFMFFVTTPSHEFLTSVPLTDLPTAHFSFNHNIERLLYMTTYHLHLGFAIVKDSSLGSYRVLRFQVNATSAVTLAPVTFESSDNALIESFEHFAMHFEGTFLYMATADRLFRANLAAPPPTTLADITDQLNLPAGYRIATLDFLSTNGGGNSFQPFLTVGSYNPNGVVGENGRLDMFDIDTGIGATGDLTLRIHTQPDDEELPMTFTGIGRPVSVAYRGR